MATFIEAIIFEGDPDTAAVPPGLPTVPLGARLTMLPLTADVPSQLEPAAIGDERIPSDWMLRQPAAALARALSADRRALYIVTETAGGPGTKEAIAWSRSRLIYGPSGTCDIEEDFEPGDHLAPNDNAVNEGLRAMGVRAAHGTDGTDGTDEYETVGLDRHRFTEDWLTG